MSPVPDDVLGGSFGVEPNRNRLSGGLMLARMRRQGTTEKAEGKNGEEECVPAAQRGDGVGGWTNFLEM
jgi:hypothetical protein